MATPLMALTIPPAQAAAIMLPVLCLMDIAGVRAYLWRWDRRILRIIVPAGVLGSLIGALTIRVMSDDWIRILLGSVALGFLAWTLYPKRGFSSKPGNLRGLVLGHSFGLHQLHHARGQPAGDGLPPAAEAGQADFRRHFARLLLGAELRRVDVPYLWLGLFDARVLATAALLVPAGIAGIYAGLWMQRRIDVRSSSTV